MGKKYRIALFGDLSLQHGSHQVVRFRTRKTGLLLARLALEPKFHAREKLIEWLWPDCDPAAGRNRLSVTLTALRHALDETSAARGNSLLIATHDAVRLNPHDVTSDVIEWEAALSSMRFDNEGAALRAALPLFGGRLLSGTDDDFFNGHARRLNADFCSAVCRLAQLAPVGDSFVSAQLRRAAELDPLDEAVARALRTQVTASAPTISADLAPAFTLPGAPAPRDRCFGREREINSLTRELQELFGQSGGARLLTLTGAGGNGKTRLALEIARCLQVSSSERICFVPLAALRDERALPDVIGQALELPRAANKREWERIFDELRGQPTLLILDNFEHLVERGASAVQNLLEAAPQTVCLATSRRPLGLPSERTVKVVALPIPTTSAANLSELSANATVQMLLDRLGRARREVILHPGNAAVIAQLCRALEGVPLAIELAAARGATLSPAEMLEALQDRAQFLRLQAGGALALEPRHASVHATLNWSVDLLRPELARLFTELSVFRGGWTLESARAVCHAPGHAAPLWWSEAHEHLSAHALLFLGAPDDQNTRFELGETVRQFAAGKLSRAAKRAIERRHARHFLELFERAIAHRRERVWADWLPVLEREIFNLRAACEWALLHDAPLALRLVASAWWFWFLNGNLDEAREFLQRALEASSSSAVGPAKSGTSSASAAALSKAYAEALCGAGFLAWRQGDLAAAAEFSTRSLTLCRASGDRSGIAYSLIPLMMVHIVGSDFPGALACAEEGLKLCRELNDQYGQAFLLHLSGSVHEMTGEIERSWSLQEQSLALFEAVGAREGVAYVLFNRGITERRRGDFARAIASCEASRALFEKLSNREGAAYARLNGALALERWHGDASTIGEMRRALGDLHQLGAKWGIAIALEALSMAQSQRNSKPARAARWWSAAQQLRAQLGAPIPPVDRAEFAAHEALLRTSLGPAGFEAAWEIGRALTLDQILAQALEI